MALMGLLEAGLDVTPAVGEEEAAALASANETATAIALIRPALFISNPLRLRLVYRRPPAAATLGRKQVHLPLRTYR